MIKITELQTSFSSEILESGFSSLLNNDEFYPTIIQCDKDDEDTLGNKYPIVNLDTLTGRVTCEESSGGLTSDQASGRDIYWSLPKLADKYLVNEFLCTKKVISLLEIVHTGTEEDSNGNYYKNDDANKACDILANLFDDYDNLCNMDYLSNSEDDDESV